MSKKTERAMASNRKLCKVVAIKICKKQGRKILSPVEYEHVVEVTKRLAYILDPDEVADLRIEPLSDQLFELKEKGGPLGRKNIRVLFGVGLLPKI
jgi:hypothetical protein